MSTTHTRVISSTVAVLGLLMGLLFVPAATAQAATPADSYAAAAFKATNKERAQRDIRVLKQGDCLQKYATKQAKKMARQQRIFHQSLRTIMNDCNLSRAGENVAYGYPSGKSVVEDGWMQSAGHRENILDRAYRLMAIGARKGGDGRWYVSQVFGKKS